MNSTLDRASGPYTGTARPSSAPPTPPSPAASPSRRSRRAWRFLSTSITVVVLGAAVVIGVRVGTSGPATSPVQPAPVAGTDTTATTDGTTDDAPGADPDDDGAVQRGRVGGQFGGDQQRQDGGGRGR